MAKTGVLLRAPVTPRDFREAIKELRDLKGPKLPHNTEIELKHVILEADFQRLVDHSKLVPVGRLYEDFFGKGELKKVGRLLATLTRTSRFHNLPLAKARLRRTVRLDGTEEYLLQAKGKWRSWKGPRRKELDLPIERSMYQRLRKFANAGHEIKDRVQMSSSVRDRTGKRHEVKMDIDKILYAGKRLEAVPKDLPAFRLLDVEVPLCRLVKVIRSEAGRRAFPVLRHAIELSDSAVYDRQERRDLSKARMAKYGFDERVDRRLKDLTKKEQLKASA